VAAESACRVGVVTWSETFVVGWAECCGGLEETLSLVAGLTPSIGIFLDLDGNGNDELELSIFFKR